MYESFHVRRETVIGPGMQIESLIITLFGGTKVTLIDDNETAVKLIVSDEHEETILELNQL